MTIDQPASDTPAWFQAKPVKDTYEERKIPIYRPKPSVSEVIVSGDLQKVLEEIARMSEGYVQLKPLHEMRVA
mgnify:FL=1